ncbi:Fasciclin-like arabinogalactan protein [Lachnellula suecica]|uniref:Fasciclin-like arabinogalactan protein n=1 Tax=Lachnellula suecica TaxID=602035 RepID=A0A8T9C306_9HELO|nr:Fasciclin-like arabinogalactan protein [Lachnellula suecica]
MNLRIPTIALLASLVTNGAAITLLQAIGNYPQLSTLNTYITNSSNVTNLLSNANNFTFLAPSNTAIADFLTGTKDNVLTEGLLEATVQYSLLRGGYPKLSFTTAPQFPATSLSNASYTNVTAGQAVELLLDSNGAPQIMSGNKSTAGTTTTDIVCTGGIIHIVSEVLSVPMQAVSEFTAAGLDYFIAILNNGGFLNSANAGYVNTVLELKDITYFIPNSAAALANATALASNASSADLQSIFQYHVVPDFVGYSSLLKDGLSLTTAQGSNITITRQNGDLYVNAAKVIASDYIVANGVVHVLDNLLDRNNPSPPPAPTDATPSSTPTPTTTSIPTANTALDKSVPSKGLTTGATIGIAVGAAVGGVLLLAAIAFFFVRRHKQNKRQSGVWSEQSVVGHGEKGNLYRPPRPELVTQEHEMRPGMHSPAPDVPMRSPDRV